MENKNILFVTTANLSTNPRLLKEVLYLKKLGFKCKILAFKLGNWYDDNDLNIIEGNQLNVQYISASRKPFFPWLKSTLIQKWAQKIWKCNSSLKLTSYASSKRSYLLEKALNCSSTKFDLVIAHNLGALFPAYQFSQKHNIPFGFDVEDYHPGEIIEKNYNKEKPRRIKLMQDILPKCKYISFASPLIEKETRQLVPLDPQKCLYISNSFFSDEFPEPNIKENGKLKFVWFSQYISYGRGLEIFLQAADEFADKIHVTIIGSDSNEFCTNELGHRNYVAVKKPINQIELHENLKLYDVGLAIEIGSVDLNKDLCISNKIFAYAQAGLYILASNTKGQSLFLNSNPSSGILADQSIEGIRISIEKILKNRDMVLVNTDVRFKKSKVLSYENEAEKLLNKINSIL